MRNILVVGAAGFVGGHLLKELKKINIGIKAIDLSIPDQIDTNITWIQGDVIKDDLQAAFENVDIVIDLVGMFLPGNDNKITERLNDVNVKSAIKIAQYASMSAVKKVIFVSSIAACEYSQENIVTEESGEPKSSYGISKLQSEKALVNNLKSGIDYVIFRPVALFGEDHKGSIYELVDIIKKKKFIMIGKGNNHVNFLYVKDFVQALVKVGLNESVVNDIFIVSDQPITLRELTQSIYDQLGMKHSSFYIPKSAAKLVGFIFDAVSIISGIHLPLSLNRVNVMTLDKWYSNSRLRQFIPKYDYGVRQGLGQSIKWYRETNLL